MKVVWYSELPTYLILSKVLKLSGSKLGGIEQMHFIKIIRVLLFHHHYFAVYHVNDTHA